ncbi:TPA: hypothetical protein QDB07_001243 [Burkholderia vietnamiensis]|uniref:hypothetical protein n=1 Tax=Burkholderia sp. AU45388 TaxID=3059206 RepID=UPI002652A3C7|nr:hypothetical protein [Burkholderia sp. AU45388]MDN7428985.1 hypothetical protein [Burkholderia sp. AU45388]HDR9033786.1 hypothetical protein [Burkholderia vietnamiensis]
MTTDNEKGPLNQMESGQEKRSASEARALSEIVNGTPSENLCRRGSPATEQASETTAQQPRTYTTQPAESVMGIALRQCGNEMEWRHILACNPEFARMLPHEYFPVGTVLNLPPHPAATSRVEQPEKSPAPEGGSEARGRWIQANCPTGDIIKSPSPSNNREFPTSMSESDCEHRIALAPSQPAAAPLDKPSVNDTITFSGDSLTLSGAQLLEALDFIAPDRDADQLESEVTIQYGEGYTGKGMYCWCTEYPEEGAIFIDGSTAVPAAPAPSPADARVGLTDEQREAIQRAIDYADMSDRDSDAEALRALLTTPLPEPRAEVTDWQPIETVPKDGTEVVLLFADEVTLLGKTRPRVRAAAWLVDWTIPYLRDNPPTHWMPLPAAPFDAARAGEAS